MVVSGVITGAKEKNWYMLLVAVVVTVAMVANFYKRGEGGTATKETIWLL